MFSFLKSWIFGGKKETNLTKMATGGSSGLSDDLIGRLAESIAAPELEKIAMNYMKIPFETIKNLKYNDRGNAVALNRSLLNLWKCMNPGDNQVQVSFKLQQHT